MGHRELPLWIALCWREAEGHPKIVTQNGKWEGLAIHVCSFAHALKSSQCFHTLSHLILMTLCGKLQR